MSTSYDYPGRIYSRPSGMGDPPPPVNRDSNAWANPAPQAAAPPQRTTSPMRNKDSYAYSDPFTRDRTASYTPTKNTRQQPVLDSYIPRSTAVPDYPSTQRQFSQPVVERKPTVKAAERHGNEVIFPRVSAHRVLEDDEPKDTGAMCGLKWATKNKAPDVHGRPEDEGCTLI
eukprot:TRINITY_DN3169_c0_g1_i1.p1 TRINITY_DN3169_c0_g1~~TRINITY_DN3169_c0_g1_i1.p1  ORF type:complete len:172 (-),score=22.77 TRINITY_DN3169_c0_g1_i1:108-623(-)